MRDAVINLIILEDKKLLTDYLLVKLYLKQTFILREHLSIDQQFFKYMMEGTKVHHLVGLVLVWTGNLSINFKEESVQQKNAKR